MKIAMVTDSFYPAMGGSETAITNLTKTFNKMGHTTKVFCVFSGARSPDPETVPTVEITPKVLGVNLKVFGLLANLNKAIREFKPDVINAHFMLKSGYLGVKVARMRNIASVVSVRGKGLYNKNEGVEKFLFDIYRNMSLKADGMLATSTEMADIVDAGWGRRPAPLSNGVDIENFRPGIKTNLKNDLGLGGKKIILCVRRLVPKNGIEYAIRAMPSVLHHEPNAVLVLASPKLVEYERVKNLSVELGIGEKVIFAGAIEHDILPQYFSIADIVVQPSIAEARSLACLEAMASGCVVLATNTGGLGELIRHKENGFLIPAFEESTYNVGKINSEGVGNLSSAIVELLRNKELCDSIRKVARKTGEEHSWEKIAEDTLVIYQKAIDSRNGSN